MRPRLSRVVTVWSTLICLLATVSSLNGLAAAQSAARSKRKLSPKSLLSEHPATNMVAARRTMPNAPPPPLTSDTWNGGGGDNNWGTASNWSAGVPTSADAVTIGTTTANVNLNVNGTFGTLTLSNVGDVLNVVNNTILTADGNITNKGQINLNSGGNVTELIIDAQRHGHRNPEQQPEQLHFRRCRGGQAYQLVHHSGFRKHRQWPDGAGE